MYPTTSAAAVLVGYGEPVEVQELPVPPLGPDALLVRVEASTMCGTDVRIQRGDVRFVSNLPLVLGHEIVGRVVARGEHRRTDALGRPLAEGDLVAWAYAWCGHCFWCTVAKQPTMCSGARMYGWGPATEFPHLTGGFAEYAYVLPQCHVVKVPDGLDPAVAASSTCSFRTVVHGFEKIGGVHPTETVVVQGSGPVGLYATALAARSGAKATICLGAPADRLATAARWGATTVLDIEATTEDERREVVMATTEGRGADLVVECSGGATAFPEGLGLVRRGGRYLVVGQVKPDPVSFRGNAFTVGELLVAGVMSADVSHYHRALEFLAQHNAEVPFADLLGSEYGLDGVNDALASMAAMRETKPVVRPNGAS